LSNPKDGNGFHFDFSKIPLVVIILAYICYFPVGVILTVLRLFGPSAQDEKQGDAAEQLKQAGEKIKETFEKEKSNEKKAEQKTAAARKAKKKKTHKASGAAGVLFILAIVFLFCGVVQSLEAAKYANGIVDFVRDILLNDAIVLYLLGLVSGISGLFLKNRNERYNVLRSVIGSRESIRLSKLAAISGTSVKKVRKDLQAMIDKGEFGEEAYIDMEQGVFMRTPSAVPDVDPVAPAENTKTEEPAGDKETTGDNFRSIILEIRRLNDEIKDFAVSERIYRIEEHTQNIFDYVTEHPEALPQIRTFLNYYLPTTLKLLESYRRIEQVGVAGENMKKSKENIESILDMLVTGYEQQVDQLFRNESIDISSEIAVLETMIKKDGLDGRVDFDFGSAAAQTMPEEEE